MRITADDLWEEIEFGLEYRGDSGAGIDLSELELSQFINLKQSYLNFLRESIKADSAIFSYPDERGIPGYPVFWDFRFIILSGNSDALFVYGSASDYFSNLILSMKVNKANIPISFSQGEQAYVNLRWFRGANRYNNGSTLYKGKYQFRFLIGRAKQKALKRSQDSNPKGADKQ